MCDHSQIFITIQTNLIDPTQPFSEKKFPKQETYLHPMSLSCALCSLSPLSMTLVSHDLLWLGMITMVNNVDHG